MSELITAFHAIGDGIALVVLCVLVWAAFFFVGPVLCAALVLLRAAGMDVPADAPLLFFGSAAAWIVALASSLAVRAVRSTWQSIRAAAADEAGRRGYAAGSDMRAGRAVGGVGTVGAAKRPNPFSFSLRDPWVAWAAEEAQRIRREGGDQIRAERVRGPSSRSPRSAPPPGGARPHAAPPPRPPPPRAPEPEPHVVLGVPRSASADAIRKAYRELVKKHHPDKVTDRSAAVRKAAHQRILEIRRAYDALKESRRG